MNRILTNKWTKVAVFVACLGPLGLLVWEAFNGGLGANPTEFIEHATGDWILRFLCHHAGHLAAAEDPRLATIDPLPPHVRSFRVFLRVPALQHLPGS